MSQSIYFSDEHNKVTSEVIVLSGTTFTPGDIGDVKLEVEHTETFYRRRRWLYAASLLTIVGMSCSTILQLSIIPQVPVNGVSLVARLASIALMICLFVMLIGFSIALSAASEPKLLFIALLGPIGWSRIPITGNEAYAQGLIAAIRQSIGKMEGSQQVGNG